MCRLNTHWKTFTGRAAVTSLFLSKAAGLDLAVSGDMLTDCFLGTKDKKLQEKNLNQEQKKVFYVDRVSSFSAANFSRVDLWTFQFMLGTQFKRKGWFIATCKGSLTNCSLWDIYLDLTLTLSWFISVLSLLLWQEKCAQYWPTAEEREMAFRDTRFLVTLLSEDTKSYYTTRVLELQNLNVGNCIIKHMITELVYWLKKNLLLKYSTGCFNMSDSHLTPTDKNHNRQGQCKQTGVLSFLFF